MDDLISRQDALNGIIFFMPYEPKKDATSAELVHYSAWKCAINCAESFVRTMPPTQPERKKGKWIFHPEWKTDGECAYECNQCGMGSDVNHNFCMRCGADMRGENND